MKRFLAVILVALVAIGMLTACDAAELRGPQGEPGVRGEKGEKGEKGEQGEPGKPGMNAQGSRGILKTEIIDGCLWITYSDAPNLPVNVGIVSADSSDEVNMYGLNFYPLPDATYGVTAGNACYFDKIEIPATYRGNAVSTILDDAFRGLDVKSVVIPDSIKKIGAFAFEGCDKLIGVSIPKSVESIGECAFANCESLVDIEVDDSNPNYKSIDGNLYSKDSKFLIQYAIGKSDSFFSVPESVTNIGKSAFANSYELVSITVGNGVKRVDDNAFLKCHRLVEIINKSNVDLDDAFANYGAHKYEVYSGDSKIIELDNCLFYEYQKEIELVKYIGVNKTLALPNNFNEKSYSIGDYAFYDNDNITSVIFPNGVNTIGVYSFANCDNLESVTMSDSVTSIEPFAFSECGKLNDVSFGNGLLSISTGAFSGCTSLTHITIVESVNSLGNDIFENCNNLTKIIFSNTTDSWYIADSLDYHYIPKEVFSNSELSLEYLTHVYSDYSWRRGEYPAW